MRTPRYRFAYKLTYLHGQEYHDYSAVGARGAVNFHVHSGIKDGEFYGGVEVHRMESPDGIAPPHYDSCPYTGGRCWHDGSSLMAAESWIPAWKLDPNNHSEIFRRLEMLMDKTFGTVKETTE